MRRHRALLSFSLRSLLRRKHRAAALSAALSLVTFLFGSSMMLRDALIAQVDASLEAMPTLVAQQLIAGRPALLPRNAAQELQGQPGVLEVKPRIWGYLEVAALEANVLVVGTELSELGVEAETERCGAVAGSAVAARLGLVGNGDRLALTNAHGEPMPFDVLAVRSEDTALEDADVFYTTDDCAAELLQMPADYVTDIAITLRREEEAQPMTARLVESMPGVRVIERRALSRLYRLTFDGRGGLMNALFLPSLALFLLLLWERLSSVGEREREEIRLLKSVGWTTADVLVARLYENGVTATLGASLGLLVAYLHVFVFDAALLAGVLFGWSELSPPLLLQPATSASQLLSLLSLVIAPTMGVALFPAWRAAMEDR